MSSQSLTEQFLREPSPDSEAGSFTHGYVAGWRSVRDEPPVIVPLSPMRVETPVMYMVGFSRGVRDASAIDEG
jgi:hypothetical protein